MEILNDNSLNDVKKYVDFQLECEKGNIIKCKEVLRFFLQKFSKFSKFILDFFDTKTQISSKNLSIERFGEVEIAIQMLEYIKIFKVEELSLIDDPMKPHFHENQSKIKDIFSHFNKIWSIFHLLQKGEKSKRKGSFVKNMNTTKIGYYIENDELLEKSKIFINSNLFKGFKYLRDKTVHTHSFDTPYAKGFLQIFMFMSVLFYWFIILIKFKKNTTKKWI